MKKMNCLLITLSVNLTAFHLPAQSLERFVVGSVGLSTQNNDIQLSFTVGEAVVSSFHTDEVQLNQGFQQTQVKEVPTGIKMPNYIQTLKAYPNPVGTTLHLEVNASKLFEFSTELYDLSGRRYPLELPSRVAGSAQHPIDLMGLAPGIYVLMIKTKEGVPVKVFKIQKM